MNNIEESTAKRLLEKSIDAFMLAIELYNRPITKNRTEAFSIFISNAWELMLKAYWIKSEGFDSIYYEDNKNRSLSLEVILRKTMTNDKDPVRENLEKIIKLRNTSTHFITDDYPSLYSDLFQSCVNNFSDMIFKYHNIKLSDYFPTDSIYLNPISKAINRRDLEEQLDGPTLQKILELNSDINDSNNLHNLKYASRVTYELQLVKGRTKEKDSIPIRILSKTESEGNEQLGLILNRDVDPLARCNLREGKCVDKIKDRINKLNIDVDFRTTKARERDEIEKTEFTTYPFRLFVRAFDIRKNNYYCYVNTTETQLKYTYSMQLVEAIMEAIIEYPKTLVPQLEEIILEKQ